MNHQNDQAITNVLAATTTLDGIVAVPMQRKDTDCQENPFEKKLREMTDHLKEGPFSIKDIIVVLTGQLEIKISTQKN